MTVSLSPKNGFDGNVALAVSGLPAGITGTFTPSSISPSEASDLLLQASLTAAPQTVYLQIVGTSGSLSNGQTAALMIVAQPQAPASRSTYFDTDGPLHELAFDPVHNLVFAANSQLNQLEVFSTAPPQRLAPLLVPQAFTLDVTPDSSHLWLANTGEFLSEVDLSTMQVIQRVTPPRTDNNSPTNVRELTTTSNGTLLLRVGPFGSSIESLLQYDPTTGLFTDRTKEATVPSHFFRSADGSKVLLGVYGSVVLYDAASDSFIQNSVLGASPAEAIAPDGSQIAVSNGTGVIFLNDQLQQVGTVGGLTQAGIPVYSRDGHLLYIPQDISIIRSIPSFTVIDAQTFTNLGQIPDLFLTGDPLPCFLGDACDLVPGGTTIRISESTGLLVGPSPNGISFLDTTNPRTLPSPPVFQSQPSI